MAESLSTGLTVKGVDGLIDLEKIGRILTKLRLACHDEFPGGACFASYDETAELDEYPSISSTGTFVCTNARSEGCARRIVEAAQAAEAFHRSNSPEGVEVSISGKLD
jgi:hypothetical protein